MSKKKTIVAVLVVVGFVFALVGGSVALGYVYVGIKAPQQSVIIGHTACQNDIIDKYNESLRADRTEAVVASLKTVATEIESRPQYAEDPSCMFMLTQYYMQAYDAERTDRLFESYARLTEKGLFPSARIANVQSLDALSASIDVYKIIPQSSPSAADAPGGG